MLPRFPKLEGRSWHWVEDSIARGCTLNFDFVDHRMEDVVRPPICLGADFPGVLLCCHWHFQACSSMRDKARWNVRCSISSILSPRLQIFVSRVLLHAWCFQIDALATKAGTLGSAVFPLSVHSKVCEHVAYCCLHSVLLKG